MDQVEKSMLQSAIIKQRVIPNGVDVDTFAPTSDKIRVRSELGLPEGALILMFAASSLRANPYKDYKTLRASLEQLDLSNIKQPVLFLGLGQVGTDIIENDLKIQFVPFQSDPKRVAMYYQASDIYVHPARADTFPTTILEASACGLPVIATDVCGIPEQVKSYGEYKQDDATGILTPLGDVNALTTAILQLLQNKTLRYSFGNNARQHVLDNFTHNQFIDAYVNWYEEILADN
jgi:glycosyltransferase involved in cell wall biosynthesis